MKCFYGHDECLRVKLFIREITPEELTLNWRMQRDSCAPACKPQQEIPAAIHRQNLLNMRLGTYRKSDSESNNWTTSLVCLWAVQGKIARGKKKKINFKNARTKMNAEEVVEKCFHSDFTCWYYVEQTRLSLHSHFIASPAQKRPIILW